MESFDPPKWADWLIEKICPEEYLEEVQGDLHEAFYWRAEAKGLSYARRKFFFESLKTIRLIRFKTPDFMKNLYLRTLKSYFVTGFRFLWKTRVFSSINIFGLAIGIASATMAFLFLSDQLSYDRFHKNADQIFWLNGSIEFEGQTETMNGASYIMGSEIPKEVPGIIKASHVKNALALRPIGEDYDYQVYHYADRDLFDMLDFTFISGSPGTFENPDQMVVSESFAEGLSQKDELTLVFGDQETVFTIVGIYKDMPNNSTLRPEIIIPFSHWKTRVPARRTTTWFDINMNVFFQKSRDVNKKALEESINKVFATHFDVEENNAKLFLQPYTELHMDPSLGLGNGLGGAVNRQVLRVVIIIGLLCLLISCFNYSNFATGNFLSRSKEVAIRKVIGAHKSTIFQQFISESFLSTAIAGLLSIALIIIILPMFSTFVDEEYTITQLLNRRFIFGLSVVIILSTLLSGIYPSLVLSSQKAGNALKSKLKVGGRSFFGWLLVMLQVSLTIFLIIGMITIQRQLNHLVNYDLGYNDENMLQLSIRDTSDRRVEQLKQKLQQLPFVQEVSAYSGYNGTDFIYEERRIQVRHLRTDAEFLPLMEIEVTEGRNFDPAIITDERQSILVNEALVKQMNLENPIGMTIPFDYGDLENPRIVGVIKDYNFRSPKRTIDPLVVYMSPEYQYQVMLLKLGSSTLTEDIRAIEQTWRSTYPLQPINYAWEDELNEARMQTEIQIQKLSRAGSIIAILLASLGLFGIVGTHVRQRLKEVSIRKVNGASPWNIYWLFSRKFGGWLGAGFIFGAIPAVYFLNNWLNNYPERINLGVGTPLLGTFICGIVFISIISFLLFKVIFVNPAVHLKDE